MNNHQPAVYILANKRNGTLYTGVTSNLIQRVYQQNYAEVSSFAKKYNCKLLVYYELVENMQSAILREKQIKAGSRNKKLRLIECNNPGWLDLYNSLI